MTTDTRHETLRECIERGGRGEFAKALLAGYTTPLPHVLDRAENVAYGRDRYELIRASDVAMAAAIAGAPCDYAIRESLKTYFPYLAHLDEPASDWPDLRGEE